MKIQLYGSLTSPYVRHCRIALRQEGLPFDLVPTDYSASAEGSPTKRVPFLRDGDLFLTDSSAILHRIRDRADKRFLVTSPEANLYFLATSTLDTAINLFLLELDGLRDSPYLVRQKARIASCFEALAAETKSWQGDLNEGILRLGCLLSWVRYRQRHSVTGVLQELETELEGTPHFQATAPPPPVP